MSFKNRFTNVAAASLLTSKYSISIFNRKNKNPSNTVTRNLFTQRIRGYSNNYFLMFRNLSLLRKLI
jgi:hypothetical protein